MNKQNQIICLQYFQIETQNSECKEQTKQNEGIKKPVI